MSLRHQNQQTATAALMTGGTGYSAPEIEGLEEALATGAHLDGIEIEGEADWMDPEGMAPANIDAAPQQIDRDAFWLVFRTGFDTPGLFLPMFKPLAIQDQEEPAARAASDAVYRLLEIYYPKALQPNSETFAQLMIAAPFIIGKVMVVRAVLAEAKAARMQPPEPPQAANDNAPPKNQDSRQAVKDTMAWMDAGEAA